jgi:hypothetical protein
VTFRHFKEKVEGLYLPPILEKYKEPKELRMHIAHLISHTFISKLVTAGYSEKARHTQIAAAGMMAMYLSLLAKSYEVPVNSSMRNITFAEAIGELLGAILLDRTEDSYEINKKIANCMGSLTAFCSRNKIPIDEVLEKFLEASEKRERRELSQV